MLPGLPFTEAWHLSFSETQTEMANLPNLPNFPACTICQILSKLNISFINVSKFTIKILFHFGRP